MFWKNGVKTRPADKFSPSCAKARNSVAYKLCVCTTVKVLCSGKFRLFYCRWSLKKQSTKTRKHFSSSKSNFIGKRKSNDRQWPNWKGNSAVHSTWRYVIVPHQRSPTCQRSTENCGFLTLRHPKVAPANGGNELSRFARKRASFSDSFWNWGGGHTTTDFFQHSA